jgi:allantoin racemase
MKVKGVRSVGDKIRICKIIPVAKGLENWGPIHEELLAEIAHDGVEVVQVDLPTVAVTSIGSNYEADLVATAHTQAALRAEAEGFDAVAMGCLGEPGVSAAKEVLQIPVVGEAGAAMHLAALVARKFSFVGGGTRQSKSRTRTDLVRQYGFSNHLASIRGVGAASLAFASEEQVLAEMMINEAKLAIEEDGAQAIIGYGGLAIIREMRRALPVPVISPIQASVIVAEMLVRAKLSQSKVAFIYPSILDS